MFSLTRTVRHTSSSFASQTETASGRQSSAKTSSRLSQEPCANVSPYRRTGRTRWAELTRDRTSSSLADATISPTLAMIIAVRTMPWDMPQPTISRQALGQNTEATPSFDAGTTLWEQDTTRSSTTKTESSASFSMPMTVQKACNLDGCTLAPCSSEQATSSCSTTPSSGPRSLPPLPTIQNSSPRPGVS